VHHCGGRNRLAKFEATPTTGNPREPSPCFHILSAELNEGPDLRQIARGDGRAAFRDVDKADLPQSVGAAQRSQEHHAQARRTSPILFGNPFLGVIHPDRLPRWRDRVHG
jgi:hypothetical protein